MDVDSYAESLAVQLRKGFLVYCVLLVCSNKAQYAGDIVKQLNNSNLTVVEGTIYPLLNRLQKDGYLQHEWQESEQGPPRKYYSLTDHGDQLIHELIDLLILLNNSVYKIDKAIIYVRK